MGQAEGWVSERQTASKASVPKRQMKPKRISRMAGRAKREQAMWQVTPKANNPKGKGSEPPKAKPFLFDNSANENAIDWILDQLPERTRFVPRLYALPLFASWTSRPPHSAVALRPRHLAAFALPAALRSPSYAIHVAAPAPHDAMTPRPRPRRSTVPTSRYPRCCVCARAPSATTLYVVAPSAAS